jgi:3-hydroxyacyl-CoA dehydrogenase/enoyl-CoA hydratase/3-hydroxybutyryl-CoA epimerase
MSSLAYHRGDDGIVVLTLDAPGAAVNTMNAAFKADLAATVERLEADREHIAGVLLRSAKTSFFAGGDLREIAAVQAADAERFFRGLEAMKSVLRRLERLGRPVVAMINGHALGGGLELALSCHHRIALDDDRIQIGCPEATLGLLPGAGGITKSVRLMGLMKALPYLIEGKRIAPQEAVAIGLVDALAPDMGTMESMARAWISANPTPVQPWDKPGHRIPGGSPSSPAVAQMLAGAPAMLLDKTRGNLPAPEAVLAAAVEGAQVDFDTAMRIESRYLTRLATGQVAKNMIGTLFFQLNEVKAGESRPGNSARHKAARVGILGAGMMGAGIAWACASRGVACVLKDLDIAGAQKGKSHSEALLARRVERGTMTSEAAQRTLALIQPTADAADLAGCDLVIEAVFENREVKARATREAEAVLGQDAVFASNTSTLPISGLAKASARPERFIGLHFFSPVDKMPLVEIIRGRQTSDETVARAFDFVLQIGKTPIVVNDSRGFYTSRVFGSFVNEGMALLGEGVPPALIENIAMQAGMPVGPLAVLDEVSLKLADDVLHQELADLAAEAGAAGHDHDHEHGHTHDHGHDHDHAHCTAHDHDHDHEHEHGHEHGHGHHHGHEAHGHDHAHGHAHAHDHAHDHAHGDAHGRHHDHDHPAPAPASAAAQAAGKRTIPIKAAQSHGHSHSVKSRRMAESAVYVLEKMAHGYKRMGRAHGGGFYDYPEGEPKQLWPGLDAFAKGRKRLPAHEDIRDRLLYAQAIETVRCLQEGVLESTRDANIGSIFGWGFPVHTGGTAQFVNHVGVVAFVARARELASRHGERFEPPALLIRLAAEGKPL